MTIRSTLILLMLACAPAYCQANLNDLSGSLKHRLADILKSRQIQPPGIFAVRPSIRFFGSTQAGGSGACSIPLLSAISPGTPVPMPKVSPQTHTPDPGGPGTIDRMKIVAPAPACQATAGSGMAPFATPPTRP